MPGKLKLGTLFYLPQVCEANIEDCTACALDDLSYLLDFDLCVNCELN